MDIRRFTKVSVPELMDQSTSSASGSSSVELEPGISPNLSPPRMNRPLETASTSAVRSTNGSKKRPAAQQPKRNANIAHGPAGRTADSTAIPSMFCAKKRCTDTTSRAPAMPENSAAARMIPPSTSSRTTTDGLSSPLAPPSTAGNPASRPLPSSNPPSRPLPSTAAPISLATILAGYESPNQPDCSIIPGKVLSNKTLKFQKRWYEHYPWIHYHPGMPGVVCFLCAKAEAADALIADHRRELAFISDGFCNWKKADQRFLDHDCSEAHATSKEFDAASKRSTVSSLLSSAKLQDQAAARACLKHLIRAVVFLVRQGLSFAGHSSDEGNFAQLMKFAGSLDAMVLRYMQRTTNFTSHECLEEICRDLSHSILRALLKKVESESTIFSVVCDGTLDIKMTEQLSICIRYVDRNLVVHEDFLGFYELTSTDGETIFQAILDGLLAIGFDRSKLRGQTYDGASNMTGEHNGCQALVRKQFPLALHFKCASHSTNLVAQSVCESDPFVADALQSIHELGKLHKLSGKFHRIYLESSVDAPVTNSTIRPLCPTRFLCRGPAIVAALENYEYILHSLYAMGQEPSSKTTIKARGLYEKFQSAGTFLGLKMAISVIELLEGLNRTSQSQHQTVSGFREGVRFVNEELDKLRNDQHFSKILKTVAEKTAELELEPLKIPRFRRPPGRYTGPGAAYEPETVEKHFRKNYVNIIDQARMQIKERFDVNTSSGIQTYEQLESVLLSSSINEDQAALIAQYPEINVRRLSVQLPMFNDRYEPKSLYDVKTILKSLPMAVRELFCEIEALVRLLLVCPVSSCEAERSFSALRRLKTWLRSTIKQIRLNYAAVCHCHKDLLDEVDIEALAKEFASRSEIRRLLFGSWE